MALILKSKTTSCNDNTYLLITAEIKFSKMKPMPVSIFNCGLRELIHNELQTGFTHHPQKESLQVCFVELSQMVKLPPPFDFRS
ncbi:Hypothetical predicted protein [Podarcis lilfordi]|uniref:Uncharacterized protein n=1 Tax=Podarcis lilfordi TaxID=74358 RepID=A0AA35L377_9SAUR|nr:Hypothetical predicted protein [Podarcis lilfordi]